MWIVVLTGLVLPRDDSDERQSVDDLRLLKQELRCVHVNSDSSQISRFIFGVTQELPSVVFYSCVGNIWISCCGHIPDLSADALIVFVPTLFSYDLLNLQNSTALCSLFVYTTC